MSARLDPFEQAAADRAFVERAVASHNRLVCALREIVDACEGGGSADYILAVVEVNARIALAQVRRATEVAA